MMVALYVALPACSPPDDSDPSRVIGADPCSAPWRTDTAHVRTTIRFEAIVDTTVFPIRQFAGSGLRISLVLIPPPASTAVQLPCLSVYSVSANYLDIPATGLPFDAEIPPEYFRQYNCARLAAAIILLHHDEDDDETYGSGETIVGAGEQSLYAFAQGDMRTVSRSPFESVFDGSNVMIRSDASPYPPLRSSPDYHATIFILNVRGEESTYNIPYPWPSPALPIR